MRRIFLAALLMSTWASAETTPDADWAQSWLDQAYLPRHQALSQTADQLAENTAAFCQQQDNKTLSKVRLSWLASSHAWRSMDGAPGGPMLLERLGRKIDFRPTRPDDIESAIKGGDSSNAATRGLPAIEYLLWGNAQPKQQLTRLKQTERCAYLVKLAEQVASNTHTLDAGWQLYREQLAAENPFFRQNLLLENNNLMLTSLASMLKRLPSSAVAQQYAEWRSGSSKTQLLAQLDGFTLAQNAIIKRIKDRGDTALAQRFATDLHQAQQQCHALPSKLEFSQPRQRIPCSKAITQISQRLQNEVAQSLELNLSLGESDGD